MKKRIKASDGYFPHRGRDAARPPDQVVLEALLHDSHCEARKVLLRLGFRQEHLQQAKHAELEVGLLVGSRMCDYHRHDADQARTADSSRLPQSGIERAPGWVAIRTP